MTGSLVKPLVVLPFPATWSCERMHGQMVWCIFPWWMGIYITGYRRSKATQTCMMAASRSRAIDAFHRCSHCDSKNLPISTNRNRSMNDQNKKCKKCWRWKYKEMGGYNANNMNIPRLVLSFNRILSINAWYGVDNGNISSMGIRCGQWRYFALKSNYLCIIIIKYWNFMENMDIRCCVAWCAWSIKTYLFTVQIHYKSCYIVITRSHIIKSCK